MTDDSESNNDGTEGARAFLDTIDAIGEENPTSLLAESLFKLQSGEIEPMDMTVEGPADETRYYLDETEIEGEYHPISRDTTRLILEASPRNATKIRIFATRPLLSNQEAVQRLCDCPRIACDEDSIQGRTTITPEVLDDVFSIYEAGLHHIHFFDSDGKGIAARYDDRMQQYWLPRSVYEDLEDDLPENVYNAIS